MINILFLSAGIIAFITFLIHTFYGGKKIARPLLESKIDPDVKHTMYATWHLVTVTLLGSAGVFMYVGVGGTLPVQLLTAVSVLWLVYAIVFLWVSIAKSHHVFQLPQWIILLAVGVLGLLGLYL